MPARVNAADCNSVLLLMQTSPLFLEKAAPYTILAALREFRFCSKIQTCKKTCASRDRSEKVPILTSGIWRHSLFPEIQPHRG
jgi:hypothetical protein